MSPSKKKPSIQKQIKKWFFKTENAFLLTITGFTIIVYSVFLTFYGEFVFLGFLTEFTAGMLGVLWAFSIERHRRLGKENRDRKDLLDDLRAELEEIKQTTSGKKDTRRQRLFPDVWESGVSSGQLRLLSSEQVKKLSKVYRYVKDLDNERRRVRDAEEEWEGMGRHLREDVYKKRYERLSVRLNIEENDLRKMIEEILQEKWWDVE